MIGISIDFLDSGKQMLSSRWYKSNSLPEAVAARWDSTGAIKDYRKFQTKTASRSTSLSWPTHTLGSRLQATRLIEFLYTSTIDLSPRKEPSCSLLCNIRSANSSLQTARVLQHFITSLGWRPPKSSPPLLS